ncbi:hypothetical protein BGZ60DRAFT_534827 [Tricladium varicosporioides]|nr:hypothetical protein BGZ60DRAFT_534827 [Hymenoscyphus varicosporioides]
MSLSRAFTTKRSTKTSDNQAPMPSRSLTTKHSFPAGTIRHKISAPIELISTTNMLSYNAPDIYPKSASTPSSASSRTSSDDDSAHLGSTASSPTSTDNSSIGSLPGSPEPNHLSCYFGQPSQQSVSGDEAPVIPKRAPSHTKKHAEILARKRSVSRMSSPKNSISTVRSSINMFTANIDVSEEPSHPFDNELAQVTEVAEDYGITQDKMAVVDEEEQELVSRGLFKFRAEDYISEIQGLFASAFGDARPSAMSTSMWI